MGYRFPIIEGDRVALAPHLDLWMTGVRFGKVISVKPEPRLFGANIYTVWCNQRTVIRVTAEDLLGAVNTIPGQGDPGASTPSTDNPDSIGAGWPEESTEPDCEEFREFGSCIHSEHMMAAGR